jgi:hypothetical protein
VSYYVYLLIDPRDNKPFYVGKGRGSRVMHHEAEARTGKISAKCSRIREIWSNGLLVRRQYDSEHETEEQALDCEQELIQAHDGLLNVTHNSNAPRTYTFGTLLGHLLMRKGLSRAKSALRLCVFFPLDQLHRDFEKRMWHRAREIAMAHRSQLGALDGTGERI